MKNKIISISLVLVVILALSAAAFLSARPIGNKDQTSASDVVIIKTKKDPISTIGSNGAAALSLEKVNTRYGERTAIKSTAIGSKTSAYCQAGLSLDLYNYETYVIEFDVFIPEGSGALLGLIHLALQNADKNSNYFFESSAMRMKNIDGDKFTLSIGDTTTNAKEEFHVEYRFNINKYDMTKSSLSVYIDGVIAYDSSETDTPIFQENARYVHSVKIKDLYSYEGGSVVLANLKVKGISR